MYLLKNYIYQSSPNIITIVMLFGILIWGSLGYLSVKSKRKSQVWKTVNIVGIIGGTMVFLYATLLTRQSVAREIIIVPFYSFYEALKQPEYYRSMLMNVFLFEPIGLTLPFVLPDRICKKTMLTLVFGFLFCAGVEIIQAILCLGRAEVDDIICNTLGCAMGTGAHLISKALQRRLLCKKI